MKSSKHRGAPVGSLPVLGATAPAPPEDPGTDAGDDLSGLGTINIRNLSIKCGNCDTYQTLMGYERRDDWNVYTYECENDVCDPAVTRTYLEVPAEIDEFARRDPGWHGGRVHAGARHRDS